MTTETKLTARQQVFAKEYAYSGNGTQSAKNAGYSDSGAHVDANRLLKNTKVLAEIDRIRKLRDTKTVVDQNFVIQGLREIATTGETESNRVRAYELLGKHLRMFVDVSETTHTVNTEPLQTFTVTELLELRAKALSAPDSVQDGEFREISPDAKTDSP